MSAHQLRTRETIQRVALKTTALARRARKPVAISFNGIGLKVESKNSARQVVQSYRAEFRRQQQRETIPAKAVRLTWPRRIPRFALANGKVWQKMVERNKDTYGRNTLRYTARWAHLMEKRMLAGGRLEEILIASSHQADTDGVSGFMHGAATGILLKVWGFRELLRNCLASSRRQRKKHI